jgi:branched-subunit amino acid transport protein
LSELLAHQKLAVALIVLGLVGAGWGLWSWQRYGKIAPGLRAFLLLCEAVVLIQDLLGLVLLAQGHRPANLVFHLMYGAVSALVIPVVWLLSARSSAKNEALYMSLGALLFAGVTFRALAVAS